MPGKDTDQAPAELVNEADAALADLDMTLGPAPGGDGAAAPAPDNAPDVPVGKLIGDLLDVTFNGLLVPKRGEHWALSRDESSALGEAYGAVVDKYFPDLSGGPEVTALMLSAAILGPRIAADIAARRPAEKPPAPAATQGEAGAPAATGEPYETKTDD